MIFNWLIVAILAYVFFGLSSLGDKLVLTGKPKPSSYAFYVGALGLFVIFFIPFVGITIPNAKEFVWIILDAAVHAAGIYVMFVALQKFEVSKVMATIGATQPIFIFILTLIFWGSQAMGQMNIMAFAFLFIGSVIISFEKTPEITIGYLKLTIFSSLMFSLDYIFSKFVFLNLPFWQGIIWIRLFVFLFVLFFLLSKKARHDIFARQTVLDKKTQVTFFCTQACGGLANLFQSFAIALAPVAFLATVNSLRGIQYVFLFFATLYLSFYFPKVLKEELSKRIIFQKIISIIIIVAGLAMLVY